MEKFGYAFESDTDTEAVAKLAKYIFDTQKKTAGMALTFTQLVKAVCKELQGAFALIFKSAHFPNQLVAARRGSPLLIGVKTLKKLKVDFVDVDLDTSELAPQMANMNMLQVPEANIRRTQSRSFLGDDGIVVPVEYILASDASAIIEHTKVLFLNKPSVCFI